MNDGKELLSMPADPLLPSCVIFDIDGTLRDDHGQPYPSVVAIAVALQEVYPVVILSGARAATITQILKFLGKQGIHPQEMILREDGDRREDREYKATVFTDHIKPRFNVICVFEDRTAMVRMWRDLGVPCFQVTDGNY